MEAEAGPFGGLGTTIVFQTYEEILVTGSVDRDLALALLKRYELLVAIRHAADILEKDGRLVEADRLRYPLAALSKWGADQRDTLRVKAIALLEAGKDIKFAETKGGAWKIEVADDGTVTISGPLSMFCESVPTPSETAS